MADLATPTAQPAALTLPECDVRLEIALAATDAAERVIDGLIAAGKVRGEARAGLLLMALMDVGHGASMTARQTR